MSRPSRILLVDDERSLRVALSDLIAARGYEVTTAGSGEEALEIMKHNEPDLILLDISMPGMGGLGFFRRICDHSGKPSRPVLILTARSGMGAFFSGLKANGVLQKGCTCDELLDSIAAILPCSMANKTAPVASCEDNQSASLKTHRVLLGEDDPHFAALVRHKFEHEGFCVETVESGPDLIEKTVAELPDAVAVKRILPGMNGDHVASVLAGMSHAGAVPVIVYDEHLDVPEPNLQGRNRSFVPGRNWRLLLNAVRKAVNGR
ncbi:MAG: response regulator [Lentisphaerae bacterium]|nr:response regulator [Lentisphaerota bacterium]